MIFLSPFSHKTPKGFSRQVILTIHTIGPVSDAETARIFSSMFGHSTTVAFAGIPMDICKTYRDATRPITSGHSTTITNVTRISNLLDHLPTDDVLAILSDIGAIAITGHTSCFVQAPSQSRTNNRTPPSLIILGNVTTHDFDRTDERLAAISIRGTAAFALQITIGEMPGQLQRRDDMALQQQAAKALPATPPPTYKLHLDL